MSRNRRPFVGSTGSKTVTHRTNQCKHNQTRGSSSHPHPAPPSILLSDATMTPWRGLAHVDSSFITISPAIAPPRPPPLPPSPPPVPQPTPTSLHGNQEEDEECSRFSSEIPSPCQEVCQKSAVDGVSRDLWKPRRVLPQPQAHHPPRLPPLCPVTSLSFSRSFTFSFFELPLHHSPHCRTAHVRNLLLLLKQMHY